MISTIEYVGIPTVQRSAPTAPRRIPAGESARAGGVGSAPSRWSGDGGAATAVRRRWDVRAAGPCWIESDSEPMLRLRLWLLCAAVAAAAVAAPEGGQRRELQRTATGIRLSDAEHLLENAVCRDDWAGLLDDFGMTCSSETMHLTEEECTAAGFTWQDSHDNDVFHHCWRSDHEDVVRERGCGAWFLEGYETVADLCPFTCYGCDGSIPFDALNRLFLDFTINAPDITLTDLADVEGQGGLVPTISAEINDLSCDDLSLGNLAAKTEGPERRPGVLSDGSTTQDQDEVTLTVSADNIMVTCRLDIKWCIFPSDVSDADTDITCSGGDASFQGSSTVVIYTAQAKLDMDFVMSSPDLTVQPPCLPAGTGYARTEAAQACTGKHGTLQPQIRNSNGDLLAPYAEGGIYEGQPDFCRMDLGTLHEVSAAGGTFTTSLVNFLADFSLNPLNWGEGDILQDYIVCPDCKVIGVLKDFLCKQMSNVVNDELGGLLQDLSASIEPYVNPNAADYLCKEDDAECREENAFRGPEGMTRGQQWPEGDALEGEEALLSDPRVLHPTQNLRLEECGSTEETKGYVWVNGVCRKPLVILPDNWLMQFVNESVRGAIGQATDPPTEITLTEDGSWEHGAVNELFSNLVIGPLQNGVLNMTDLAIAAGGDLATMLTTSWDGNYTLRASEEGISAEDARINDQRAVNISVGMTVEALTVTGFDSFTRFDPLRFVGKYSLGSGFTLDELQMSASLSLTITAPDGVGGAVGAELNRNGASLINGFKVLKEPLTVQASIKDLSIDFAVMLALNQDSIGALTLGELLDKDLRTKCVVSTIELAEVTKLELSFADIREPVIGGFISAGFDQFVQEVVHGLYVTYRDVGSTALHNAIQTSIRELLNTKISNYVNNPLNRECFANTEDSFGDGAKFPWYFSLGNSLDQYGLTGLDSPLAYAKSGMISFLADLANTRESDEVAAAKRQQAVESFDYSGSQLLYVDGLDSVVMEPEPDVLIASGEASTTARIIDEPTSLHSHVSLDEVVAAAYFKHLLPFTPKELSADWTSQEMAGCTPASLVDLDLSGIGLTFDFDLHIPNMKLHALRLVDLLNTECWLKTVERFAASGSVDIGGVEQFAVSCDNHDETQKSCSALTRVAAARSAGFDTADKNQLASLFSDGVSALVKAARNGLQFCDKTATDASFGDHAQCPTCPDWMQEVFDPQTGLGSCLASEGWIREECDTLNRVAGDVSELLYGDLDELVPSDTWLQAERDLVQDDSTAYLDLNLSLIRDIIAPGVASVVSGFNFDEIHLENPLASGPINFLEPDQSRSVNITLPDMGTIPISILPSHGLNLSIDTLDIAVGNISSVHMLQLCPHSPECSSHGFLLGPSHQPGRYTLWHAATLERLKLTATASATNWIEHTEDTCCVPDSMIGSQPGNICIEDQLQTNRVQVNAVLRDIKAVAATMIAINVTALQRLKLAPLFSQRKDTPVQCALTSISSTALTHFRTSVHDISKPDVAITGQPLQAPTATVLGAAAGAAVCLAEPILTQHLPSLLSRECYQDAFNTGANWYLEKMQSQCNMSSAGIAGDLGFQGGTSTLLNFTALLAKDGVAVVEHDYCDFEDTTTDLDLLHDQLQENSCTDIGFSCDLWSEIERIVARHVLPWQHIRCMFQTATASDVTTGWPPLLSDLIGGLNGHRSVSLVNISGSTVKFVVEAVTFSGLDRGYDVNLLRPVDDSLLSEITVGTPEKPFKVKVDMQVGTASGSLLQDIAGHVLAGQDKRFASTTQNAMTTASYNFTLILSAHGARAFVNTTLGVNVRKMADLVLPQIANLECWSSVFEHLGVFFGLDLGTFSADVECHGNACDCNTYAASVAHTEVECAAAGSSCDWIEADPSIQKCKPDWLTSMKMLWNDAGTQEGFEGIVASMSNLVNTHVVAASDEIVKIRDYAIQLYDSFGAIDMASTLTSGEINEVLRAFEQLVVQDNDTMRTSPSYNFLNLKSDGLVKFSLEEFLPSVDAQAADLNSLVEDVLPGGNLTIPVNMPLLSPLPGYQIDGKTWFEKLISGAHSLFDFLEVEETQDWILETITLTGLNSLKDANVFQPTEGNLTFLHQAAFQQVGVVLNVTIHRKVEKPPEGYNIWWSCVKQTIDETSTIVMAMRFPNVEMQAATLLAVDLNTLFGMQLGRVLHEPLGCVLSAVKHFNVSFVDMRLGQNSRVESRFSVSGNPLPALSTTLVNLLRGSEALVEPLLQAHLPGILQTVVPVVITDMISGWLDDNAQCSVVHQEQLAQYPDGSERPATIDFVKDPFYTQLHQLIDTHKSKINEWVGNRVQKMTTKHAHCPEKMNGLNLNGNCSGVLIMMRDNVPGEESLKLTTGSFDLQISDVMVTGLDSLGETLEILDPIAAHRLNTTVMTGTMSASAHIVLKLNHGAEVGFGLPTHDEFRISVGTDAIMFVLGLILEIKTHELWELTFNNLNIEDCWRHVIRDPGFDLDELVLKFGLEPAQELNLRLECLSCESSTLRRIDASLQQAESGSKLGTSLNNILHAMATSVLSGTGFNVPHEACNEINGNTSIILEDVLSLQPTASDSGVTTKTYAAIVENQFKTDPQRGGNPTLNLVNLRCDEDIGCSFDGIKTGAAGLVAFGLDQAQRAVNTGLVEWINKAIESSTCKQTPCWEQYVEVGPVVLRDSTQSLPQYTPETPLWPDSAVHFLDGWVQESGEKWELTGVRFKSLRSIRNVSVAKPLHIPEQNGDETYTLWNEINMGEIIVELNISVVTEKVSAPFTCNKDDESDTDIVIVTTGARDLHVGIATMLAINEDKLNALQAGQFFNHSLSCLVSTIHALEITAANLSIGSLISPTMEKDMNFGKMEHLMLGLVGPAICVAQPVLNMIAQLALGPAEGDINLREIVNGLIQQQLDELASECQPLSNEPPDFFDPFFNFETAAAKMPLSDEVINIMRELSIVVNNAIQPQTINALMSDGLWDYTRSEDQIHVQNFENKDMLCNQPCPVKELELCWGNWGGSEDSFYQPENRSCSAATWEHGTTGVGYDREMYSNSCGRSCSDDPKMFFEFFKRPQNSSVTGKMPPDNIGVLGEMAIEIANIQATGLENLVHDMQLLDITGKYAIGNYASLFAESPATVSVDVRIGISGMKESLHSLEWPPAGLDTDFTLTASIKDVEVALEFVLQIRDRLRSVELVDFFKKDCVIRIVEDMLPTLLEIKIGEVGLGLECRKCTPKLQEWQNRTTVGANLAELTAIINAFIDKYADHFEVAHDASGTLMHTADDRRDSDDHMHSLLRYWLYEQQGLSEVRTGAAVVDGDVEYFGVFELTIPDEDVCAGVVHRTSALEEMNITSCGELVIPHSTYGEDTTFESANGHLDSPKCNALGQECEYKCQSQYHLQGRQLFDRVGTVRCQETGEYTETIPCVPISDTAVAWWESTQDDLGSEVLIVCGILAGILFSWCCAKKRKTRRERKLGARDMLSQEEEEHRVSRIPTKGDGSGTGQGHRSLMKNRNLPCWVRYYVPIVLTVNVLFFVMGHIYTAASVDIVLKLFGKEVRIDGIVTMSLGNTLKDMLNAKNPPWPLIILLGGMSGVWPYTKLTMIYSCWMLPPSKLRPKKRGQLLMTLDALGKWSLIDLYVMLFFMLAFRVNVTNPDLAVLPPELWEADLKLTAVWGLFAFTIAVISSLVVNNLAIHYHRNALAKEHSANLLKERESKLVAEHHARDERRDRAHAMARVGRSNDKRYSALNASVEDTGEGSVTTGSESESNQDMGETSWYDRGTSDVDGVRKTLVHSREALRNHVFSLDHYEIWFPGTGQVIVGLLLVASIVLTVCGAFIFDSFVVNCYGMGAAAMNFGTPGSAVRNFTVFTSFSYIMEQADADETQEVRNGIYALAYSYIIFAVVIPLMEQVGMLILWTMPLTLRRQKMVFFTIEVLHGWASMPVFLLGLAVSILEVGMLSGSLVPKGIAPMELLRLLQSWDIISETDADAGLMQITMEARFGLWLLVLACFCEYLAATIVVRSGEVCLDEREWRIAGRPPNEEQEMGCGKPIMNKLLQGTTCCCIPVSPGLRYMPRCCVKRHNLTKLLSGGQDSSLSQEDAQEVFQMAALMNPMDAINKAGVVETADLRRSMMARTTDDADSSHLAPGSEPGRAQSDPATAARDSWSELEAQSWDDSIAMAETELTQWRAATEERKRTASSSYHAAGAATRLPLGWTTTMWNGEVYYWNSITGETAPNPPGDEQSSKPEDETHSSASAFHPRHRGETSSLDESTIFEEMDSEPRDEEATLGIVRQPTQRLFFCSSFSRGLAESGWLYKYLTQRIAWCKLYR